MRFRSTTRRRSDFMSPRLAFPLLLFTFVTTLKPTWATSGTNHYDVCIAGYTGNSAVVAPADLDGDGFLDLAEYIIFIRDDLGGCLEGYVVDAFERFAYNENNGNTDLSLLAIDMQDTQPNVFCLVVTTAIDWACPTPPPVSTPTTSPAPSDPTTNNGSSPPTAAPNSLNLPVWIGIQYTTTSAFPPTDTSSSSAPEQQEEETRELLILVLPAFVVASLDQVIREEQEKQTNLASWKVKNQLSETDLEPDEESCKDPYSFCWVAMPNTLVETVDESATETVAMMMADIEELFITSIQNNRLETILTDKLAVFFSWNEQEEGSSEITIDIQLVGGDNVPTPSPTRSPSSTSGSDPFGAIEAPRSPENGNGTVTTATAVVLGFLSIGVLLVVMLGIVLRIRRRGSDSGSVDESSQQRSSRQQSNEEEDDNNGYSMKNSSLVSGSFPHQSSSSSRILLSRREDSSQNIDDNLVLVFEDNDMIFEDPVDRDYYFDKTTRPLDTGTPLDPAIVEILSSPDVRKQTKQQQQKRRNDDNKENPLDILSSLSFFSPKKKLATEPTKDDKALNLETGLSWIAHGSTSGAALTVADITNPRSNTTRGKYAMPSPAKSYTNSSEGTGDSDIWSEDGDGNSTPNSLAVGSWDAASLEDDMEEEKDQVLPNKSSSDDDDEAIWFIDDDDDDEDSIHGNSRAASQRGHHHTTRLPENQRKQTSSSTTFADSNNPRFNLVLKDRKFIPRENRQNHASTTSSTRMANNQNTSGRYYYR